MSGNHSEVLPAYRPCCDFYEDHCNGAKGPSTKGPGEERSYTPAQRAAQVTMALAMVVVVLVVSLSRVCDVIWTLFTARPVRFKKE